jgi:hypothetical protein
MDIQINFTLDAKASGTKGQYISSGVMSELKKLNDCNTLPSSTIEHHPPFVVLY